TRRPVVSSRDDRSSVWAERRGDDRGAVPSEDRGWTTADVPDTGGSVCARADDRGRVRIEGNRYDGVRVPDHHRPLESRCGVPDTHGSVIRRTGDEMTITAECRVCNRRARPAKLTDQFPRPDAPQAHSPLVPAREQEPPVA